MSNVNGPNDASVHLVRMERGEVMMVAAALRKFIETQTYEDAAKELARRALGKVDRTAEPEIFVRHGEAVEAMGTEIQRRRVDSALEAQACAMVGQYGFFLPGPAKDFLRELAAHLNWNNLKGRIK